MDEEEWTFEQMISFLFYGFSILFSALIAFCIWGVSQIPSKSYIKGCFTTSMYQVELCPDSPNYVPLKHISKFVQKTLILAEDSTFYQHQGFDWESIEKSYQENREKGTFKRGGSTITQQLAKNLFLTREKTITRKALEALLTLKIEQSLTKNEILERYLNVVEFGENIYGIKAAAQYYFKKSPSELDVAESAFLIMLLPNPVKYSASFKKKELTKFAKNRITTLVNNLYQYQRITDTEHDIGIAKIESFFSQYGVNAPTNSSNTNQDPNSDSYLQDSSSDESNSNNQDDFL